MGKIYIIGKDERQMALRKLYEKEIVDNIDKADYIIMPTPLTKDGKNITGGESIDSVISSIEHKTVFAGKIPKDIVRKFEIHDIKYYDIMEQESIAIYNAVPTAEGVILKILQEQNETIYNSNILILGFGKCGKILADRLKALKANVFCEARKKKDLALINCLGYNEVDITKLDSVLKDMDIIINTVPYMLLNARMLSHIKENALIIDIASAPGGTDFEYCKLKHIRAYLELGIPAKVASVSAAKYIKEFVDSVIGDNI